MKPSYRETQKGEAALKKIGYDTLVGESITMSTLGILPDPIITPMIDKNDPTELVYVIFHERTHQLFFRKNEITFNENAAVLMGCDLYSCITSVIHDIV